ncbi:hypothetical protein [Tenacibaculum amylolyticum]|uniref:hypothetical protein n=1 Tax=Tenacibaculum amylolyticum TaxID=104269 RepID=UPI0038950764
MENKTEQKKWEGLKNTWNSSTEGKEINFQMNALIKELETMVSPFEKDFIVKDIAFINESINQFEIDSIQKDLDYLKNNLPQFEKNIVITGVGIFSKLLKKIVAILRGKNNG